MINNTANYTDIRDLMQPGDIIAFSGKGHFSRAIKQVTEGCVSHVGVILQSKLMIDDKPQDGYFNQIIESATINGFSGVSINRLSERLASYSGEIWWLPLSQQSRAKMDTKAFYDFLLHQESKEYDLPQAIKAGLDMFDNVPLLELLSESQEDYARFFCSELVAAGLKAAGVLDNINASEVTPIDLCRLPLFQEGYYQIKGLDKDIAGFNGL